MDPEKQPLLIPVTPDLRHRGSYRPLTTEEVRAARQDVHWRRGRCLLIFFFWGLLTMALSMIACILVTTPKCRGEFKDIVPSVSPVHINLAPLISQGRMANDYFTV